MPKWEKEGDFTLSDANKNYSRQVIYRYIDSNSSSLPSIGIYEVMPETICIEVLFPPEKLRTACINAGYEAYYEDHNIISTGNVVISSGNSPENDQLILDFIDLLDKHLPLDEIKTEIINSIFSADVKSQAKL